jgi:predicted phospho-2-dehydro-3-deoxyheptonate aldolase
MLLGKKIRLERIMDRESGRTVIVPMDHGVTVGPIPGLIDMRATVNDICLGGANAVLGHVGLPLHGHRGYGSDIGLILHLSASTSLNPDPDAKVLVGGVETALMMGADAVSIHINLGAEKECQMLADLGTVSQYCLRWGMPLIAMMYCRGAKIDNEYDVKVVKHAARVAAELGADVVKVNYTGAPASFREVTEGCPIPVVIAGGEKVETDEELMQIVAGAIDAGAAGVSIGRNVFQHKERRKVVEVISSIVHRGASSEEAVANLRS